jgi:hypothetical protein
MSLDRRTFIVSASAGLGALATMGVLTPGASADETEAVRSNQAPTSPNFPKQDPAIVGEFVGSAHRNFDRVREMLEANPELIVSAWEWGFGDWETALGAASHMGRLDIGQYLLDHGARADVFSMVLLGKLDAVQAMLAADKSIATTPGPHGISLLKHASAALRFEGATPEQKAQAQRMYDFMQTVEGAAGPPEAHALDEKGREEYLGRYLYGSGPDDVIVVSVNMQETLSLKPGKSGAQPLVALSADLFAFAAARSVHVQFERVDGKPSSVSILAHGETVRATRE